MSYSRKDAFIACCLVIFIITFAVIFVVFFKQLYYSDINYLGIDITSGLSQTTIKENYSALIDYQSIFYQGDLNLPAFVISSNGKFHFGEVKRIFEVIQILMVISGILSIGLIYSRIKEKEYRFLKLTGIISIVLSATIGLLSSINFNEAFVIFHKLLFRNDFWIFDYNSEPIIRILPEAFFMHALTMIVAIIITLSLSCIAYYSYKQKQILKIQSE